MNKDLIASQGTYYIKTLIAKGENQFLDFKFSIPDARKIARTLVAFANTNGGTILIGVKDNGTVAGVRSEEEIFMIEAAANLYCYPLVQYSINKWIVEGKTVLEIIVEKSKRLCFVKDHFNKKNIYIRSHDKNILANRVYVEFQRKKDKIKGILFEYTEAERKILLYLSENKNVSFSKLKRISQLTHRKTEDTLINLLCLNVIEIQLTEKGALYNIKQYNTNHLSG